MKCPKCQFENSDNAKFCKRCGAKLVPPAETGAKQIFCRYCGNPIKAGGKFCTKCGKPVVSEPIPQPAAAQPKPVQQPAPKAEQPKPVPQPAPEAEQPKPVQQPVPKAEQPKPVQQPVPEAEQPKPVQQPAPEAEQPKPVQQPAPEAEQPKPVQQPAPETVQKKPVPQPTPAAPQQRPVSPQPTPAAPQQRPVSPQPTPVAPQQKPVSPQPIPVASQQRPISPRPQPASQPIPPKKEQKLSSGKSQGVPPLVPEPVPEDKPKTGLIILACVLGVLVAAAAVFAVLLWQDKLPDFISGIGTESEDAESEDAGTEVSGNGSSGSDAAEGEEGEDALPEEEIETLLLPASDLVASGREKLNSNDYQGAVADFDNAMTQYVSIGSENDITEEIDSYIGEAYAAYSEAIIAEVTAWETQDPSVPWYQQVENTLNGAIDRGIELTNAGYTVDETSLKDNLELQPARWKEKYIWAINDLCREDGWSRTTAWMYMQDASTLKLVDKSNTEDPLTLRYAFALAWYTQRSVEEGLQEGSMTAEDAVDSIVPVLEEVDYNPVLVRELATTLQNAGDKAKAKILIDACEEVWNYLAYTENVYILPSDMLVSGRGNVSASSTIELKNFLYFNDFGEYSPSTTNGVSAEGREKIREIFKNAVSSLGIQ